MDTTASQGRSWLAVWTSDPADPPVLPADSIYQTIDGFEVVRTHFYRREFYLKRSFQVDKRWGGLVRFLNKPQNPNGINNRPV